MGESMLMKRRRDVSLDEIRDIYERQHYCCIYCNNPVDITYGRGRDWTLEHIIPYAVYKWSELVISDEDRDELWKAVNHNANCAIACRKCNERKDSIVPNLDYIMNNKVVPDGTKEQFREIYKTCENAIIDYNNMLKRLHIKQKGMCLRCNKRIKYNNSSVRRFDDNKPRVEENALILCSDCSFIVSRGLNRVAGKLLLRSDSVYTA